MKFVILIFIIFKLTFEQYITLNNSNYKENIDKLNSHYDYVVIFFYNDWSMDSKHIINTQFPNVYYYLSSKEKKFSLAICNQKQNEVISFFNLDNKISFPKILLYDLKRKSSSFYSNIIKYSEIVKWIDELSLNEHRVLRSIEEIDELLDNKERIILFTNTNDSFIKNVKEQLPKYFEKDIWFLLENKTIETNFKIENKNTTNVILLKNYDEYINTISSNDISLISSFLIKHYNQILYNYTNEIYHKVNQNALNYSLLFFPSSQINENLYKEILSTINSTIRGEFIFILVDYDKYKSTFNEFVRYENELPFAITYRFNLKYKKFFYHIDYIKKYFALVKEGDMKRIYKSEAEYWYNKEDKVHRLVGENFNKVIYEDNKNKISFVFLTKRLSELCRQYETIFTKFAIAYKDKDIFFGVIDITENEIDIDITTYPSFIIIEKENVVQMEDSIVTVDSLSSFLTFYKEKSKKQKLNIDYNKSDL